jgi:hypothetical protein
MPNTLGVPYVLGVQSGGAFPLVDPRLIREERGRFLRDDIPALRFANSVYVPTGKEATRAFVLVSRQSLDLLSRTSGSRPSSAGLFAQNFQIQLDECVEGGTQLTLGGLSVVHATCCTRGIATDPNAVYLVELTDARGILRNQWFSYPCVNQYNLLAPAYPGQYYEETLDITLVPNPAQPNIPTVQRVPWTWSRMVGDLWGSMTNPPLSPAPTALNTIQSAVPLLGNFPGMPVNPGGTTLFTPAGTPQGWGLVGVPALDALQRVLEHLGLTIACDLTAGQKYTVVNNGADDPAFDELTDDFADRLEDDYEFVQPGSARVPGTVRVLFHRRNREYGTEETIRPDGFQWVTGAFYAVDVTPAQAFQGSQTPRAFQVQQGSAWVGVPVGTALLWDDFTVRADADGQPVAADVTLATTLAAERARQLYNYIYSGTSGSMHRRYAGLVPFTTGSLVDGVCWKQDHQHRLGWTTTVVRREPPVWPELEGM